MKKLTGWILIAASLAFFDSAGAMTHSPVGIDMPWVVLIPFGIAIACLVAGIRRLRHLNTTQTAARVPERPPGSRTET
jgi:hypothetical protein